MKGTVTRLYTPDNPALLPAICGPQHRNLMKLEMALIDGKLKADSQGGSIRLTGSQGAVGDAEAALAHGFSTGAAAAVIGTALWGSTPTSIYEQGTATEVVVKYPPKVGADLKAMGRIRVPTPSGMLLPISALATLRRAAAATTLHPWLR